MGRMRGGDLEDPKKDDTIQKNLDGCYGILSERKAIRSVVIAAAFLLAIVLGIIAIVKSSDSSADAASLASNSSSTDNIFAGSNQTADDDGRAEVSNPTAAPVGFDAATVQGTFELLETVPHDSNAFTQGLELVPDSDAEAPAYFESTGRYGQSSVRRVDLATGRVLQKRDLDSQYFAEGLTYFDGKLIQLTYRAQRLFIYDATTLETIQEMDFFPTTNSQGWGICHVPERDIFYVSDGTSFLHTWNATTLELIDRTEVAFRESGQVGEGLVSIPRNRLNELEWDPYRGTVHANIWTQDNVVRIDPSTGYITNSYDLSSLNRPSSASVLNGIAATGVSDEFWVTGKLWPNLYRIRLIDR